MNSPFIKWTLRMDHKGLYREWAFTKWWYVLVACLGITFGYFI